MTDSRGDDPAAGRRATTVPPGATMPERVATAPAPGEEVMSHYRRCFGCGPDQPHGLHLKVQAGEGLTVAATFTVAEEHQGAPGLAHGGLLVTAMDDTLGTLNWLLATPAVTGRLETSFRRPVPVGTVLHLAAEVTGVDGRRVYCRGVARIGAADGPVALTAAAVFVQVPVEHFMTHGRPEDVVRARDDAQVDHYLQHVDVNP